jgi:hypothetical protein
VLFDFAGKPCAGPLFGVVAGAGGVLYGTTAFDLGAPPPVTPRRCCTPSPATAASRRPGGVHGCGTLYRFTP